MAKLDRASIAAAIAEPRRHLPLYRRLLREPPAEDVAALAQSILALVDNGFWLLRTARELAPAIARAILTAPLPSLEPAEPRARNGGKRRNLVFLKEAVPLTDDDDELRARWLGAVQALGDMDTTYAWGSQQRRAKIKAVAQDRRLLAAVQAATVATPLSDMGRDFMAVLVSDGSETSADALMPHFHAAITDGSGLDLFDRLKTHASDTSANRAMLAQVAELLAARNAASPALALAPLLGLQPPPKELWFSVWLFSVERRGEHMPQIQCNVDVDSRDVMWLRVSIVRTGIGGHQATSFSNETVWRDDYGLGTAMLAELPAYLARAGEKIAIVWDWDGAHVRTGLRGQKRAAPLSWLRGSR